jgi:hypothetical protein
MFNDYDDVKKQVGEYDPEIPDRALRRKLRAACREVNNTPAISLSFGDKDEESKLADELNGLLKKVDKP